MSKSGSREPRDRAEEPRRPAWRVKFRRLMEEARGELEAEKSKCELCGATEGLDRLEEG